MTTAKISEKDENRTLDESRLINLFKFTTDAEVSFNTTTATLIESNGTLSTSHAAFVSIKFHLETCNMLLGFVSKF